MMIYLHDDNSYCIKLIRFYLNASFGQAGPDGYFLAVDPAIDMQIEFSRFFSIHFIQVKLIDLND